MSNRKMVFYVAHPVTTDARFTLDDNLSNVEHWIHWLTLAHPEIVFIAPWVAEVRAFRNENVDASFYDRVLSDDEEVVRHCDGIILTGGKVSTGMRRELGAAIGAGKLMADLHAYRTPEEFLEAGIPMFIQAAREVV